MFLCYGEYINPQAKYSYMEIRVLKNFLAVGRDENILQASKVLHITQPSLSRQFARHGVGMFGPTLNYILF